MSKPRRPRKPRPASSPTQPLPLDGGPSGTLSSWLGAAPPPPLPEPADSRIGFVVADGHDGGPAPKLVGAPSMAGVGPDGIAEEDRAGEVPPASTASPVLDDSYPFVCTWDGRSTKAHVLHETDERYVSASCGRRYRLTEVKDPPLDGSLEVCRNCDRHARTDTAAGLPRSDGAGEDVARDREQRRIAEADDDRVGLADFEGPLRGEDVRQAPGATATYSFVPGAPRRLVTVEAPGCSLDDVSGALVRVVPLPAATPEDVADVEEAARARGARAVSIVRLPPPSAADPTAPGAPAMPAGGFRAALALEVAALPEELRGPVEERLAEYFGR